MTGSEIDTQDDLPADEMLRRAEAVARAEGFRDYSLRRMAVTRPTRVLRVTACTR